MGNLFGGRGQQGGVKKIPLEPRDAHIKGALFVATVDGAPREFENNGRRRWAITFREYPKHVYYAGYLQMKGLAAMIGNDDSAAAWDGQRLVLEAQEIDDPSVKDRKVWKFYPVSPSEWTQALRDLDGEKEPEPDTADDTELAAVMPRAKQKQKRGAK